MRRNALSLIPELFRRLRTIIPATPDKTSTRMPLTINKIIPVGPMVERLAIYLLFRMPGFVAATARFEVGVDQSFLNKFKTSSSTSEVLSLTVGIVFAVECTFNCVDLVVIALGVGVTGN